LYKYHFLNLKLQSVRSMGVYNAHTAKTNMLNMTSFRVYLRVLREG